VGEDKQNKGPIKKKKKKKAQHVGRGGSREPGHGFTMGRGIIKKKIKKKKKKKKKKTKKKKKKKKKKRKKEKQKKKKKKKKKTNKKKQKKTTKQKRKNKKTKKKQRKQKNTKENLSFVLVVGVLGIVKLLDTPEALQGVILSPLTPHREDRTLTEAQAGFWKEQDSLGGQERNLTLL